MFYSFEEHASLAVVKVGSMTSVSPFINLNMYPYGCIPSHHLLCLTFALFKFNFSLAIVVTEISHTHTNTVTWLMSNNTKLFNVKHIYSSTVCYCQAWVHCFVEFKPVTPSNHVNFAPSLIAPTIFQENAVSLCKVEGCG